MSYDDPVELDATIWRNVIGGTVIVAALAVGVGWCGRANGLWMDKTFAPKEEQVRKQTFEESKAYNQGMVQELQNMQFEYIKAKPEQQAALASIILHRAADYDADKLPTDLRSFINKLKSEQGKSEINK
jgi:hypothetical protein